MKGKNATNLAPDTVAALPQELRRRWNGANQVLIWKPRSKIWKGPTQHQFHLFISFTSLLQFVGFHLFSKLCLSVLFFAACSFSCMLSCFIVRHQVSQSESGVSYRIYRAWERTICLFISTASGALVVGPFQKFLVTSSLPSKNPGDSSECSMEQSQSANGSLLQSVVVCGSLW